MKRKAPPTDSDQARKRQRLDPSMLASAKTPRASLRDEHDEKKQGEQESVDFISPLMGTENKISPRPAQLIAQQLQTKRILSAAQQQMGLAPTTETDVIYENEEEEEEEEQEQQDQDKAVVEIEDENDTQHENEPELGRGTEDEPILMHQEDIELDQMAESVAEHDEQPEIQHKHVQFDTIAEHRAIRPDEDADSENAAISQPQVVEIEALREPLQDITNEHELSVPSEISQMQHIENEIDIDREHDADQMLSQLFKDANISEIPTEQKEEQEEEDVVERSMEIEEDEKAMELSSEENVILPRMEMQQQLFQQTVPAAHVQPKSYRKQRKQTEEQQSLHQLQQQSLVYEAEEAEDTLEFLTPISAELKQKLNKSMLQPTTRSRRKQVTRSTEHAQIVQAPQEPHVSAMQQQSLYTEPQRVSLQRPDRDRDRAEKRRQRQRKQAREVRDFRTHSLLDVFRKEQMIEIEEEIEHEEMMEMNSINEEEDELRQMVLNQSGLGEQWKQIEKERAKKRRKTRRILARYSQRKRKQRRNASPSSKRRRRRRESAEEKKQEEEEEDVSGSELGAVDRSRRQRSSVEQAPVINERVKEKENALIAFWREIEEKMENEQLNEDIQIVQDEREINVSGRRPSTPPRIAKHLERRYRREYENVSGEKVEVSRKKKGRRVYFCKQKQNVLNEAQMQRFERDQDNSLISVTPTTSPSPSPRQHQRVEQQQKERGGIADELLLDETLEADNIAMRHMPMDIDISSVDAMSVHSLPPISGLSTISSILSAGGDRDRASVLSSVPEEEEWQDEDEQQSVDSVLVQYPFVIQTEQDGTKIVSEEENRFQATTSTVASGYLLPSIAEMNEEGTQETDDHEVDMQSVDDPFANDTSNTEQEDRENRLSHIVHHERHIE